jgi:hypothetical protein
VSFLTPVFFAAALAVAAGAVGLHFIVTRQPPSGMLPTARFVPAARVDITTLTRRPEDLLLLVARVLMVLLIGAAFARPVSVAGRRAVARVVLGDVSRAVADARTVADSVRAYRRPGDLALAFDSTTRAWDERATAARAPGRLSSALIAGIRAGLTLRTAGDSVELVIVSPLAADAWDGATLAVRALWPGRIRLVQVPGRPAPGRLAAGAAVEGENGDPVSLAVQAAGIRQSDSLVRIVRRSAMAADSAWARGGGTLVRWPASAELERAGTGDTAGAVVAGDVAVVYPFARHRPDPVRTGERVVARWVDGSPAAVDRRLGAGCVRDVAIPVPSRGDLILRPDFARLLARMAAPCDPGRAPWPPGTPDLAALAGSGPLALGAALPVPEDLPTPLVPWLLAGALVLALVELRLRGRPAQAEGPPLAETEDPA